MNDKLIKTLSNIVKKLPKNELEANLSKAKEILKTSSKNDLEKILSTPQVTKLLGKDAKDLKEQIKDLNLGAINPDTLESKLHIEKRR